MSGSAALRVHTPNEVAPLAAKEPGTVEQFEALFHHPEAKARIAPLLAPGDDYERIVALAMRAMRKMPDLLMCTRSTLLDAAATIVGWNLEIGDTAHMVPFNVNVGTRQKPTWEKHCTPIMDYKGMAQILIASRVVRAVDGWCVYEKEAERGDFQIFGGTEPRIHHIPHWKGGDRGAMIGAYVVFQLANNRSKFHFMRIEEINAIRYAHSKKWGKDYQGNETPCPPWWAIKCCIRQARKLLATTPALEKAFNAFRQEEELELAPAAETRALPAPEDLGSPADGQPLRLEKGDDKMLRERTMSLADAEAFIIPRGNSKGERLDSLTPVQMRTALLWTVDNDTEPDFQLALATVLDARQKDEEIAKQDASQEATQESGAEGESAVDAGAVQDSPGGENPKCIATPAPAAAPAAAVEDVDQAPDGTEGLTPGQLKSKALELLKHPCMNDRFITGQKAQLASGLSVHQLRATVRTLESMIDAAKGVTRSGKATFVGDQKVDDSKLPF
jgi:recombination protein RecT